MATHLIHLVFLLASLVCLVGAETSVKEFKALQDEIFGRRDSNLYGDYYEGKIEAMVKLIEAGGIPAEMQGEQSLEYLKSLANDCKINKCNIDEDLQRLERLRERDTGAPNLKSYLIFCRSRIKSRCSSEVENRASEKLSSLDDKSMEVVQQLALQTYDDLRDRGVSNQENSKAPNDETVLKTLKTLHPAGSKKMLKRCKSKEMLAKFMNQIRLPCEKFMEKIDPSVKMFEAKYWGWNANKWHYYLNTCEKVVGDWEKILQDAYVSYVKHLA